MKILQVSNIISHHQLPLAHCFAGTIGENNFRFAATQPPSVERRRLGYEFNQNIPWILRAGENEVDRKEFECWWDEADVVFCGDRLFDRMKSRCDSGRLTFHMSERWWKPPIGIARMLHPRFALKAIRFRQLALSPFFHFLSIGDYSAIDIKRITSFVGRLWGWGYFTKIPDPLPSCVEKEQGYKVLWGGRMLGWKRVDTLIRAFSRLLLERPDATLTLVGDGANRKHLEQLAKKILVAGSYRFLPPMPAVEIPKLMRQHHVYVLPSNGYEGWGAVVNEAMAEGCAVVASRAAGAAKTIIRHNENGLLFKPGKWQELSDHLCFLAGDDFARIRIAQEGQRTIVRSWSPNVAADRFLAVCDALLSHKAIPAFDDGPMTPTWSLN